MALPNGSSPFFAGGSPLTRVPSRNGNGQTLLSNTPPNKTLTRSSSFSFLSISKGARKWPKIIILVSFIMFLAGLWTLSVGPGFSTYQDEYQGLRPPRTRYKYAFCTLLCDDIMAEATMVMVHSVKRTGTPHDVVILTMNVSNRTIESLKVVGAKIEPITDPVAYPFTVTADRAAINKPCRYSKLLMWNMVQYKKIVYLDSDLLIVDNIDELFEHPEIAAVPDTLPPDKFNSGLMVVEPNRATFLDMINKVATTISPNVGDQGFLNSYYHEWYRGPASLHLDYRYNALVRISVSPAWSHFIEPGLKVLHFSGNTKPWNMMMDKQFPTTRRYDHLWWQVYDDVYYTLGRTAAIQSGNSTDNVPQQLSKQCKRDHMAYARGHLIKDKLSVVMNCFDRFDLLMYMVQRYASFDFVYKIYIVWGNTHVTPFRPEYFNVSKEVEILYSGIDSLNDRFKPIESLETEAILIGDDDIEVSEQALRVALERWKDAPYRLVGFFPRAHYRDPTTKQLVYVLSPKQEYSIVLTKMFLMHGDYLRAYTCAIPQELRDYVDDNKNCEDIAMNFLVTQLSGLPPLLMEDSTKMDYGTTSGLSSRGSHDFSRSVCMNDIAKMLGYMSLRNTSETATYFERDKGIHITQHRRKTMAVADNFRPIFNPQESRISSQFMGSVPIMEGSSTAEMAIIPAENTRGAVLCIQGDNDRKASDTSTNRYALLAYGSIPNRASQISGTTFIIHSAQGFEGRFTMLNLVSSFLEWRVDHGCFAPARVILYHDGMLVTKLSPWSAMVIKALLGNYAQPSVPADPNTPECFESVVVARQRDTVNLDACNPARSVMRRTIHAYCRSLPQKSSAPRILEEHDANVRIAFVGDGSSWGRTPWFNYTRLETSLQQECAVLGLSCQIMLVPRGDFCGIKVLGLSRADIMIGPWSDRAMDNVVFLRPGTAVLELLPPTVHEEDRKLAKKETQCLDLRYDQLANNLGPDPLISWVSRQLDNIGRRGRVIREEEPTLLEECVKRNLRY